MGGPMETIRHFAIRRAKHLAAILLIAGAYSFSRLPALSEAERGELASRFSFSKTMLPELQGYDRRYVRDVHPSLQRIASWISSVGASVALNDLDGDGLPNDVCYVDTRIDQVVVAPVPGTPSRYTPFALSPSPLPYNPATMAPMGCLPGDFNEDGLIDVLVYYWGRAPILFLRKPSAAGERRARLSADAYARVELVPSPERWFTNAATQADLDGDGHVDLIIGNYFPDGAQILDAAAKGSEHMQHSMSHAGNGGKTRFLLWDGVSGDTVSGVRSPHFRIVEDALPEEVAYGWTLAAGAADLDGDQLPEVYLARDFGTDRLLHNVSKPGQLKFELLRGEKTLTTPRSKVLGQDSFKGMGVDFGDLNGDGRLDICVSTIAVEYALEETNFTWISTGNLDVSSA